MIKLSITVICCRIKNNTRAPAAVRAGKLNAGRLQILIVRTHLNIAVDRALRLKFLVHTSIYRAKFNIRRTMDYNNTMYTARARVCVCVFNDNNINLPRKYSNIN